MKIEIAKSINLNRFDEAFTSSLQMSDFSVVSWLLFQVGRPAGGSQ